LRRPAGRIDLLELAVGEESNVAAVRRSEGILSALGAGERLRGKTSKRSHPQLRSTLGQDDQSQTLSIG
jgi:hypothetical protein